jgi:two-component system OmpR family sensor kinase
VLERTSELSAAHETLQQVDQRRRQLLADLSHELRTPATAIRGEAEIALRGAEKPPTEYRETLTRIVGGVKQLTGVIDDLLLVARPKPISWRCTSARSTCRSCWRRHRHGQRAGCAA